MIETIPTKGTTIYRVSYADYSGAVTPTLHTGEIVGGGDWNTLIWWDRAELPEWQRKRSGDRRKVSTEQNQHVRNSCSLTEREAWLQARAALQRLYLEAQDKLRRAESAIQATEQGIVDTALGKKE